MALFLFLTLSAHASIQIRDTCATDSIIVATIQETDPIQIRHAVAGESQPCYAVSINQIHGFILGNTLPATQDFERKRAQESRIAIPEPPPPPVAVKQTPTGPNFEPWTGIDSQGKRMKIAPGDAKVTLVTFWSAESGTARRSAENLMKIEPEFKAKGLKAYGLVQASSLMRLNYYLDDMGLDYPQALDRQGLAAKYKADPARGTTLVLDGSNNVVAISSNPSEIRAAVTRLLSLE